MLQSAWERWALFVLGWTVLSLLFVPEAYLFFLYRGDAIPVSRMITLTLANAGIVCLFLPAIIWLSRRYPLNQRTWRKALLVHIPACLLFSLSHSWLYAALCYASPKLFHMLFIRFHPNLLTYWAVVGFALASDYFRRYSERERELAQAELHLLRAQLQPHFLFNCLHTISAMVHEDVHAADRMINRLSELLRVVLESIGKHKVPLAEELSLLEAYVEIERIRFEDRLALKLEVDPEAMNALVPSMILQPLAENSIRHGFKSQNRPGTIFVDARRCNEHLVITFRDDGCGFDGPRREGLGLSNIRRRLEQLYGNDHRFAAESLNGSGARFTIQIPYRVEAGGRAGVIAELINNEDSRDDRGRRAMGAEANRQTTKV